MMRRNLVVLFLFSCMVFMGSRFEARAEGRSGADVLMQSAKPKQGGSSNLVVELGSVELNNPLVMHFFTEWQAASKMSFHQNLWARQVLEQKWGKIAHLWPTIRDSVDDEFAVTARSAYVFALWNLNLGQTFWNEWFEMARVGRYRDSKAFIALSVSIQPEFAKRFYDWGVHVEREQAEFLLNEVQSAHPIFDTVRAHILLRQTGAHAKDGETLLLRMPKTHPYYSALARTLALHFARQGDLGAAGSILKKIEPITLGSKDPEQIASYYLQIARLLYQSGNLSAASVFYRKVPKGSRDFLTAREELAWVLLQSGEFGSLRGELQTFRMDVWKDKFLPEVHLVSAIGNLKLCFYGEVRKDFDLFLSKNKTWAGRVEAELAKADPSRPERIDFYIERAEQALTQRQAEQVKLRDLARESKTAALPAVGVQPHWLAAEKAIQFTMERTRKRQMEEYRRVWRSRRFVLQEAIRKMQFVKVELMSQMSRLAANTGGTKKLRGNVKTNLVASKNSMTFPFDGVAWPDEFFNLQSVTEGECL